MTEFKCCKNKIIYSILFLWAITLTLFIWDFYPLGNHSHLTGYCHSDIHHPFICLSFHRQQFFCNCFEYCFTTWWNKSWIKVNGLFPCWHWYMDMRVPDVFLYWNSEITFWAMGNNTYLGILNYHSSERNFLKPGQWQFCDRIQTTIGQDQDSSRTIPLQLTPPGGGTHLGKGRVC